MVYDSIDHCHLYDAINKNFGKAFNFLKNSNLSKMENGRYEIDGDDVFAIVQSYETKEMDDGKWEAHKKYIDIQYMVEGKELMGFADAKNLTVSQDYNEEKDILFFKGEGNFVTAVPKYFTIFFPNDAHMPGMTEETISNVKKVVVKVKV